jgi:hypothetical protein
MGYIWFRIWRDDTNRTWAEPFRSGDPAEAKQRHRDDSQFRWAVGVHRPGVTELQFTGDNGSTILVRPGVMRETDDDRRWQYAGADAPTLPADWQPPVHSK